MNGTFRLYYDDQNRNRYQVQGASWSLSLAGGASSAQLTFTPPTNPTPRQAGQYVLVFHGQVGQEQGVVAGRLANLGSYTLTVALSGGGTGTVTSSPEGINCGTTCAGSFPDGATVTLTATAGSGSTFAG